MRLSATWAVRDRQIRELTGCVRSIYASLRASEALGPAVRAALAAHPATAAAFDVDLDRAEGSFGLRRDLLHAEGDHICELAISLPGGSVVRVTPSPRELQAVADLLHRCSDGGALTPSQARDLEPRVRGLHEVLVKAGAFATATTAADLRGAWDGIMRLQHASLLFRSGQSALVTDPHFNSDHEPEGSFSTLPLNALRSILSGVLISHGHADHFHLPTFLQLRRDLPIIVPRVERPSILCPDMAGTLRELGFTRVIELSWFDPPVRLGAYHVAALPFYGEQPIASEPLRDFAIRNCGNTYLVRGPRSSTWVLIDSGNEHAGTMAQVAEEVARRFGPVDYVASNLRPFEIGGPCYISAGPHYWLSLSTSQIIRFESFRGQQLTLGPEGVAEVCKLVGARTFLPYAHWWAPWGEDGGENEHQLVGRLANALRALGAGTRIVGWRIGEYVGDIA